jgi:transcription-repair coupling factor (superfamily II helicase)
VLCQEIIDRFGTFPTSVIELVNSVRLRWLGEKLGFEKLSLKNDRLRAYFVSNRDDYFSSEIFGRILNFVKSHSRQFKMKDSAGKAMLAIENIKTVDAAIELLSQMADQMPKSAIEILSK